MGKRNKYTSAPVRPLAAKLAWSYFIKKREEPALMCLKGAEWVATFANGETLRVDSEVLTYNGS